MEGDFVFVGQKVTVTSAIVGTVASPLIITFPLDGSIVPEGEDETTIQVFKDWVLVPECPDIRDSEDDFPCVSARSRDPSTGDITITVFTLDFSVWTLGVAVLRLSEISAPTELVPTNTTVDVSATFNDHIHTPDEKATWAWGDSTSSECTVGAPTAHCVVDSIGTVTGAHEYSSAGVYTVTLTLTDTTTGASATTTFRYLVVYDPDGGFVAGGGWIWSPAGAYVAEPSLEGKATFGFVSKYKKGADVPTGNTEFQFHAAGLDFHSTDYQWLVIAGPNAKFKGTGTINGEGDYGFMLTAVDGDHNGGGGVDQFRIKIWDKATGEVVYDNKIGVDDDEYSGTELGGGSIVIHKATE